MLKRKCKITYIAHGATIYTEDFRLCCQEKYPPLEEKGQEEIKKICQYIKQRGVKNDKIYTDPTIRSIQSAQIISKICKENFEILPTLLPRNWGDWNGLTIENIVKKNSFNYKEGVPSIMALTPENGEAIIDFNNRIDGLIKEIVANNIGHRIIIVTGQSVIQSVVAKTLGMSPEMQSRILIKTGSATQISYFDSWSSLIYSNYVPL